jgi:hypothetical protein
MSIEERPTMSAGWRAATLVVLALALALVGGQLVASAVAGMDATGDLTSGQREVVIGQARAALDNPINRLVDRAFSVVAIEPAVYGGHCAAISGMPDRPGESWTVGVYTLFGLRVATAVVSCEGSLEFRQGRG